MTATITELFRDPPRGARWGMLKRRETIEQMLERACYLAEPDRLLLEQVYRHGLSATDVARLTGESPRRVQRRVRRLLDRLNDPIFAYVISKLGHLPRDVQPTARRAILQGRTLRETAELTGLTVHHVRQNLHTLRTLLRHT